MFCCSHLHAYKPLAYIVYVCVFSGAVTPSSRHMVPNASNVSSPFPLTRGNGTAADMQTRTLAMLLDQDSRKKHATDRLTIGIPQAVGMVVLTGCSVVVFDPSEENLEILTVN